MRVKKAQILALTIFMLFISLGIVIVLLMPINQQVIRVRKILYSFQALTMAESGLEIGNLYAMKSILVDGFSITSETYPDYSTSPCANYFNFICERMSHTCMTYHPAGECSTYKIKNQNEEINIDIHSVIMQRDYIYSPYIKTISQGNFKGLNRVLDFDFLP